MISNRLRPSRRGRPYKMPKNIEHLYKEGKCREFSVLVSRMDFAKILGKFTKVKIQYESSSTPKSKPNSTITSPNSNARLKSNENGMVLIHRNAYSQHPVKELLNQKKTRSSTPQQVNNILKENNRLKKTSIVARDKNSNYNKKSINSNLKHYGIIFINPSSKNSSEIKNKVSLAELLPVIDKNILPSEEWCIDYFPKSEEPKEDKVYDRIAAELEDLMYNEKPLVKMSDKSEATENKVEEFPSIMDILNDNSTDNAIKSTDQSIELKSALESSDVEAMLLGKTNGPNKDPEPAPMEVDNTDMNKLIDAVEQLNEIEKPCEPHSEFENPHSPSILDEALQKGIEEHLPCEQTDKQECMPDPLPPDDNNSGHIEADHTLKDSTIDSINEVKGIESENKIIKMDDTPVETELKSIEPEVKCEESNVNDEKSKEESYLPITMNSTVTHIVFKKTDNGICHKSVMCPKNLKYSIEIEGKPVEFVGAPKFISSLEDLQVLLQIVNESDLQSLHVFH